MEWKIGEIKQVNGEWYQCVKNDDGNCSKCDFHINNKCTARYVIGSCGYSREDNTLVIFKKLEKVGNPINTEGRTFQRLNNNNKACIGCVFYEDGKSCDKDHYIDGPCPDDEVWVEIKQNKGNMEEKKLNLKPFNLDAAKAGKPVCTRDGYKARIVCFDKKNDYYPIIALVEIEGKECIFQYTNTGEYLDGNKNTSDYNLMMLPEKKEGWINVKKDASLFKSREEAERNCTKDYAPVRVEFEI